MSGLGLGFTASVPSNATKIAVTKASYVIVSMFGPEL